MRQSRPARQAAGHPSVSSTPAGAVLGGGWGGLCQLKRRDHAFVFSLIVVVAFLLVVR